MVGYGRPMHTKLPNGRPPEFDRPTALKGAVVVFWERGYEATSMLQLLTAMGIARSTFYASFGSKRDVMLEALDLYTQEQFEEIEQASHSSPDPHQALDAVLAIAACTKRPNHGCLFLNTIGELASRDADVHSRSRAHLSRIDKVLQRLLLRLGHTKEVAVSRSAALLSLAAGAVLLRKAGQSERRIKGLLMEIAAVAA